MVTLKLESLWSRSYLNTGKPPELEETPFPCRCLIPGQSTPPFDLQSVEEISPYPAGCFYPIILIYCDRLRSNFRWCRVRWFGELSDLSTMVFNMCFRLSSWPVL